MDLKAKAGKSAADRFLATLPSEMTFSGDPVQSLLLREYGAMFVARGVVVPTKIVFRDEPEVKAFQDSLETSSEIIDGFAVELQAPAMEALRAAIAEAGSNGLSISPRGSDSARRGYLETVDLWKSRVDPALKHWVANGNLDEAEAGRIAELLPFEQVPEVLALEAKGIYFAKDLSKSIIYSVAPPGTSQHLSLLALDVKEFDDPAVRELLAKHQWFQTVVSDLPHFTYLGADESELAALGLKQVTSADRKFWIPDI